MEKIKISTEKITKHLSRYREIKLLLYGILIGIISGIFAQLLIAPTDIRTEKVGNETIIDFYYGNFALENMTLATYTFMFLFFWCVLILIIYYKIKGELEIKDKLEEVFPHSRNPEEIAKEIKKALEDIIDIGYKEEGLEVYSRKESDDFFNVYVEAGFIDFDIHAGFIKISYNTDKLAKQILDDFNKGGIRLGEDT